MKIKFLTLNIFNGEFLDKCIDFLKKESPDVFVLQEVYKGGILELDKKYRSLEILTRKFGDYDFYYSKAYFIKIGKTKVDSINAIFSRFPMIKNETIFFYHE